MKDENIFRLTIFDIESKTNIQPKSNRIEVTITYWNPILHCKQTAKGVAKCNPNDTYSETKGERIAESRAKANMYLKYSNFVIRLAKQSSDKHYKLWHRELRHLDNLING